MQGTPNTVRHPGLTQGSHAGDLCPSSQLVAETVQGVMAQACLTHRKRQRRQRPAHLELRTRAPVVVQISQWPSACDSPCDDGSISTCDGTRSMPSVQHRCPTPPSCAHVTCMHCLPAGLVTPTALISGRISTLPGPSRWAVTTARGSQELPAQAVPSRLHAGKAGPHGFTVAGGRRAAAGGRRQAACCGRHLTAAGRPAPPCAAPWPPCVVGRARQSGCPCCRHGDCVASCPRDDAGHRPTRPP